MLNLPPFYHGLTRRIIVAFGSAFSNIKIERRNNDGEIEQTIAVPLSYAPKEKWVVRIDEDPTLERNTYTILPRMSFEITGMTYDSSRKLNRVNDITCYQDSSMSKVGAPAPYNIEISLYVLTKTQEDALQIIEQILPYFNPEYTVSVKLVEATNVTMDVPIVLNGVSIQDDYEGDFQTRRFVTYTLNFSIKSNFFGPVRQSGVIETVTVNTSQPGRKYTAHGELSQDTLTESWNDAF